MSKPSCCRLMLPGWSNPMQFYFICKFSLLLERGESFYSSYLRRIWSLGLGAISGLLGIDVTTTTFFERADYSVILFIYVEESYFASFLS